MSDQKTQTTEKPLTWEEANKLVDKMQHIVRRELADYTTEELMEFMRQGKNPLLGDKL